MTSPKDKTPTQPWIRPHSQKWEDRPMRANRMALAVVTCLVCTAGCNLLTPLIFVGEHKKKVSPEFDKQGGHRRCR